MTNDEIITFLKVHLQAIQDNDTQTYKETTAEDLTLYEWWITPHRIDGLQMYFQECDWRRRRVPLDRRAARAGGHSRSGAARRSGSTRRTNRVFNIGLVAATAATVVLVGWLGVSAVVIGTRLDASDRDGSAQVDRLVQARVAALQARADESLTLVARGAGG